MTPNIQKIKNKNFYVKFAKEFTMSLTSKTILKTVAAILNHFESSNAEYKINFRLLGGSSKNRIIVI